MTLVLLLAIVGTAAWVVLRAWGSPGLELLFLIPAVLCLFTIGYVVFPVGAHILGVGGTGQFVGIDPADVAMATAVHAAFFGLFLAGYFSRGMNARRSLGSLVLVNSFSRLPRGARTTILGLVVLCGMFPILFLPQGYAVNFQSAVDSPAESALQNVLLFPGRFYFAVLAVGLAVFLARRRVLFFSLSAVLFFGSVVLGASGGTRAALFHPVMVLVGALYCLGEKRRALGVMLAGIAVLVGTSALLVSFRGSELRSSTDSVKRLEDLMDKHSGGFGVTDNIDSLLDRADVVSNTAVMIRYLDVGRRYAGFEPYMGVLAAPVPRVFWPDKPVAGSDDGTMHGHVSLVLARIRYGYEYTAVTAHGPVEMYWQFGWWGVVVGAFVGGYICRRISEACMHGGLVGIVTLLSLAEALVFGVGPSLDWLLMCVMQVFVPVWLVTTFWARVWPGRVLVRGGGCWQRRRNTSIASRRRDRCSLGGLVRGSSLPTMTGYCAEQGQGRGAARPSDYMVGL